MRPPLASLAAAALTVALAACAGRAAGAGAAAPAPDARLLAELLRASDARRADTLLLDRALAAADPPARRAAALALGQLRVGARVARLQSLLVDPDTGVAANAAFALGLLRDSTPGTLAALQRSLSGEPVVATEAGWAMGEIGAPARAAIAAELGVPHRAPVTAALLVAASRLRPVPVDAVVPHLRSDDPAVVRAAAYAVGRPRDPGGVRALLQVAQAADAETRSYAARGLARAAAGDSLATLALPALGRLAADVQQHVRIAALASLSGYGPAAREMLRAGARDSDANVRIAAAQALSTALASDTAAWRQLWSADTGFMYRRSLAAAAARAGVLLPALVPSAAHAWQRSADWRYRAAVADAAAGAPPQRAGELALPLLRDPDGRVRAAAYAALAPFADSAQSQAQPWRRELLRGLDDTDFFARATAASALSGKARASETPAVLRAYQAAQRDSGNDARIAAAGYLLAAWRNDSLAFTDSLRAALRALEPPADPLVAAAAQGLPLLAHWQMPPAAARPLGWYEDVVRAVQRPALAGVPPRAVLYTERGRITLELFGADAPITVHNFITLARAGYFRGTRFHRVVPGFVAQDGDPRGDGNGGPGYAIRDELNRRRYARGAVGMALSGPDTGGSQYFLTLAPQPHLDGHYTVFARVADGLAVMDALVQGDRIVDVEVP